MGIIARRQGEAFVIWSDRQLGAKTTKRAPRRIGKDALVWGGSKWSTELTNALTFESLDAADDYIRVHYAKLSAQ